MFALVGDEVLYLKVHPDTLTEFEEAGCEPFRYSRGGKSFTMSYHTCPESALQSVRHMKPWAAKAWQAALAAKKKPNNRKKR